jgi:hypothetical protein
MRSGRSEGVSVGEGVGGSELGAVNMLVPVRD